MGADRAEAHRGPVRAYPVRSGPSRHEGAGMSDARDLIRAALAARTQGDAERVQELIAADVGARNERPVTDTWNNLGSMSSTGSFDHKVIENVTNMQDALVERFARARFGDLS